MTNVYLIPTVLSDGALQTIPPYVLEAIKKCKVIFAENERTARRFLKSLEKEIVIDHFEWFTIHNTEAERIASFVQKVKEGKDIAIISEAGCPGIADPGQILVYEAQKLGCNVKPLVGPSSILLSLMASGLNGQNFEFCGYLPVDNTERSKRLKDLELLSQKHNSTKIFIETPYRNQQLFDTILHACNNNTLICIAAEITSDKEWIKTLTVKEWKNKKPELHKIPVIFLLYAGK